MSGESEKQEKVYTCLLSHPNRCLKDHLEGVEGLIDKYFPVENKKLKDLAHKVALFHDLGKSTKCFQRYIKGEKPLCPKEHSLLSALFLYRYLKERNKNLTENFLSFVAVKRHHTFPQDFFQDEGDFDQKSVKEQLKHLPVESLRKLGFDGELKSELLKDLPQIHKDFKLLRSLRRFKNNLKEEVKGLELYTAFLSIYSSLLLSDRQDAARLNPPEIPSLEYGKVKSFVDNLPERNEIDRIRKKAKETILSKDFDPRKRVYSINLPTGYGKTYTGFLFALKIVNRMRELGKDFKVIYALPFISIIEQNYSVLKELLLKTHGKADSNTILKHHYLSEIAYERDGEKYPVELSKLLTESWESSVVVTTMVQLFNALFPKNRSSAMRFSRLPKSVIILDEVQTIPLELWEITRKVLIELSQELDFYVIFMTATKPMLFKESEYTELAGKEFFKGLNRYQVSVDIKRPKTVRELVEEFEPENGKRYLFITNTIASSQELYSLLLEKGFKEEEIEYLSSAVIPYDRKERIEKIEKTKLLVSTQVVEAGMDIDFDVVIRDLAPFDSLNQSAGRCNRNGQRSGLFKVVLLKDEKNGRFYYSYIYDSLLVGATQEILKGKKFLTEEEFTLLVEDYFREIKNKGVDKEWIEGLFEAVKFLRFRREGDEPSVEKIELIREDFPKDEVFVQYNEEAVKVFNEMKRAIRKLKRGDRRALGEVLRLKPLFYDYVAKVNLKGKVKPPKDEELSIYYVPIENLEDYYGKTGLREPELIW